MDSLDKKDLEDVQQVYQVDGTGMGPPGVCWSQAALDIFENHWILYAWNLICQDLADFDGFNFGLQVMDTILWEGHRQKNVMDAMEHQLVAQPLHLHEEMRCDSHQILHDDRRRRIDFHQHYYFRPQNRQLAPSGQTCSQQPQANIHLGMVP